MPFTFSNFRKGRGPRWLLIIAAIGGLALTLHLVAIR